MRKNRMFVLFAFGVFVASHMHVFADDPGREFSAEAVGDFRGGGNRINVTFVADRFTSVEEAQQLASVLEKGGQGSLVSMLRGR